MAQRRRSILFVGALALEGLEPAFASGADLVCIDLEDAVPPDRKDEARAAVVARLATVRPPPGVQFIARVNAVPTLEGAADLAALLEGVPAMGAFMLPKVESAEEVRAASRAIEAAKRDVELLAIIETAPGLETAPDIARADPRLAALVFGGFDLSTALGCEMAWEPLLYARSRVVHAAAMASLQVIDSPYPNVDDLEGLAADCARIKALGMTGKAAKHAKQVATIRSAFTPSAAEVARAKLIVERFRADPTRPLVHEGRLIELPAIKRLERLASQEP